MKEREAFCKNCIHSDLDTKDVFRTCRIRAPVVDTGSRGRAVWPRVSRYDWCSEIKTDKGWTP